MVLASQVGRPGSSRRTNNFRRARRSWRRPIIALVAVTAAFAVWKFWPTGESAPVAPAGASAAATPGTENDANKPATPPTVPAQQAGLISSGSSASTNTPSTQGGQTSLAEGLRRVNEELNGKSAPSAPAAPVTGPTVPRREGDAPVAKGGTAAIIDAVKSEIDAGKTESPAAPGTPATDDKPVTTVARTGIGLQPNPVNTQSISVAVQAARATLTTPGVAGATLRDGMNLIADGKYVEGRKVLSKVLIDPTASISAKDAQTIRDTLMSVNKSLLFSDRVLEGDTLVEQYTVQSGDLLSIVARKFTVTYQLIEQINNVDARRIRVGQRLKVIKGPFHVVVSKSSFRMDLFLRDADGSWIYATSFPVGVGKDDSTPNGTWICRDNGKLANPGWTHPRTSEYFAPDDPKNPIGEYWIALDGTDETTKGLRGYGIHGTIDRDSIGKQMSLGCVRLLPEHIEQVYKLLVDGKSTVTIQP